MYNSRSSLYDRILEKTQEQVFINSLRKEFELSPAESNGILDLAKQCLFGQVPQTVGKIKYICASTKAQHGKPLGVKRMCDALVMCVAHYYYFTMYKIDTFHILSEYCRIILTIKRVATHNPIVTHLHGIIIHCIPGRYSCC